MVTLDEYQSKLRSNFEFIRFDVERFMHLLDNNLAPPDAYIGGGQYATAWELPTRPGLVLRIPIFEGWTSHVEERVEQLWRAHDTRYLEHGFAWSPDLNATVSWRAPGLPTDRLSQQQFARLGMREVLCVFEASREAAERGLALGSDIDNWIFGGRGRVTAVDPFAIRHELTPEAGASRFVRELYDWAVSLASSRFDDVDSVRRFCGRFVGAAHQFSVALAGDPEHSLIAQWLKPDPSRYRISHSRSARATVAEAIESAIQDYPTHRLANTYLSVPTR